MASRAAALCALGLILFVMAACSGSSPEGAGAAADGPDASTEAVASSSSAFTAPADRSRSVVQHVTTIDTSPAVRSIPFAQLPDATGPGEEEEHEPLRPPRPPWTGVVPMARADQAVQSNVPLVSMPASLTNFAGQGNALGGPCQSGSTCSTPPDTNGAVGPNDFVQLTNVNGTSGIAIWDKTGKLLSGPKHVNTLWTNYPNTDGNDCASRNDGDPVVLYDQLADRWFITQFSLPNSGKNTGPAFQCVAVSQTADPTGAYSLYDFKYAYGINDYGKFSVWPDAYYATFNMFGRSYAGDDFCAYDRASMLQGKTATQQCFLQAYPTNTTNCPATTEPFQVFGALPASADGPIPPPTGEPGYFMQFDYSQCGPTYNQLDLWTLHVDFTTPANSKLTGPTVLTVANFTPTCWANNQTGGTGNPNCLPQPGSTVTLDGLDDRLMFRFNYRNFGDHESLLVNHSVVGGTGKGGTTNTGSGIRWYEIRSPATNPTVFQQSTYAPSDGNWRWMGSIAQDQAGDMALGFAITSNGGGGSDVTFPSIAWTGRLSTDPASTMGQGEAVIDNGGGDENDAYATPPPDEHRGRWGDYSAMTVDPSDDCTFWYTQELYRQNGIGAWDTYIASMKFPSCAANDFSIGVSPASESVGQGGSVTYTVSTSLVKGSAETIGLYVQDLPTGVTGSFNPPSVTAGGSSTLTLTAAANAPVTGSPDTFMVIGHAPSAVHPATAQVSVTGCTPLKTCPAPDNCGTVGDGCGGILNCGTCPASQVCQGNVCAACGGAGQACCAGNTCTSPNSCNGGVCSCTALKTCPAPDDCGTISNGCGGIVTCGTCSASQVCQGNVCAACGGVGQACCAGNTCTSPNSCNGGVCSCTPLTTCPAGDDCGTIPNGCGGMLSCGTCASGHVCQGNSCTGCGGAGEACCAGNTCNSPNTCKGGTCSCTPATTCPAGDTCGTVADGCGGTVSCGTCGANQTCVGNLCVAVTDGGVTDSGSTTDSGTTTDASSGDDSGSTSDASSGDDGSAANDSGLSTGDDGGPAGGGDASADAATGSDGGSGNGATGQTGGCGCVTAGGSSGGSPPWTRLGFGLFAIAALRLRRRSRRASEARS